ncbi:hypothetical protein ACFP9V_01495 [Deinococcus radiopugnans]|uniref:hypothetical protein n=1 Tax=Deinococcus radiopugnans TaxID=57497 RepID=UPI00360C6E53
MTLTRPGVDAQAGSAGVTVEAFNPFTRTLRLGASVRDATVNLNADELIRSLDSGGSGEGGGAGWTVIPGRVEVQNTRVNVDGKKGEIPDGQFQVTARPDGGWNVQGRTPQGELSADVTLGDNNVITADLNADARIINFYWPGVTAGRLRGTYVLNDGPLRGDLKLTGAALRVPEAKFVTVTGIGGTVTQRGDDIDVTLAGQGWNGPVTATGRVDLKAQHWAVTADAAPTVSGLAQALGTTGAGTLALRVTAGGWQDVRVSAQATGTGRLAGIEFSDAQASYAFGHVAGEKAPQNNDLTFSADTQLGRPRSG